MATFSQFKSKYIIERRSKNVGDEGTKNIVKKLLGKDAIPDDGGKKGQARIEKELGLNEPNKTVKNDKLIQDINKRKSADLTRADAINRSMGTSGSTEGAAGANTGLKPKFSSGATGTTPSGSPEMGGESKKFVQNRRKRFQTRVLKPETKNVVKPDKFSDVVKKFQGSNSNTSALNVSDKIKNIQQDYLNKLKDQKPKVNVNKTPTTNPSLPNFTKQKTNFSGRIGNVTNITKNKGPQIPDFMKKNPIKDTSYSKEIARLANRDKANRAFKNMDTSAFDDLGTKKNPLSRKAFTQFKKDIVKKAPVKKALKFGGPALAVAGSVLDFRDTYKRSQAQGDTKRRSLGKGLSRVAGGLVGGALGATAGSAVAPGAGTYIGGYGGYVAGQAAGEKIFNTLTTSKGRKQIAKSFKNFRNKAMKPIGS